MKKHLLTLACAAMLCSCGVQQFAVNTQIKPFANGGIVFGEKTRGLEVAKKRDWFVLGINVHNADTKKMAQELNATSYTIETKGNFFTWAFRYITFGIGNYRVVKVIKRPN